MLSELRRKKYTHYFHLWDLKGDGYLEFEEYVTLSQRIAALKGIALDSIEYELMIDYTTNLWQSISSFADSNNDGKVSLAEWLAYTEAAAALFKQDEFDIKQVAELFVTFFFNLMDSNGDGQVSPTEWSNYIKTWGIEETPVANFQRLDLNGDGYVTLEEMLALFAEFIISDDPEAPGNYLFGSFEPGKPCNYDD